MADDPDESLVYCLFGAFEKATLKAAQQHTYTCDRAKADLGYRPLLSSTEGMRRVAQKYEEAEARRGRTPRPLSYFVLGLLLAVALWWALRAAV